MDAAHRGSGVPSLWAAVILRALKDIEEEPYDSLLFNEARDFLTGGGAWGQSRQDIAEQVNLHGDDIRRIALAQLAQRASHDPPPVRPPVTKVQPAAVPVAPRPMLVRPAPNRVAPARPVPEPPAPPRPIDVEPQKRSCPRIIRRAPSNAWLAAFLASGSRVSQD